MQTPEAQARVAAAMESGLQTHAAELELPWMLGGLSAEGSLLVRAFIGSHVWTQLSLQTDMTASDEKRI